MCQAFEDLEIGEERERQSVNKHRLESTYSIPARGEGNDILLLGPAEQVAAAKIDIIEDPPVMLTYEVDQRLIRSIGSYDAMAIEALHREHKVWIEFGFAKVYIEGRKSSCEKALTAIQSIIAQRSKLLVTVAAREATSPPPPVIIEVEVIVPEDTIGFIAGKHLANKKRIEKAYGVKVNIPAKGKGNMIVLQGTGVDKLNAARMDIIESLPVTLTQQIDPRFISLIVGYKGEGIKRLINEYKVKSIEFDDKKVVIIRGTNKSRCEDALKAINAIVDKRKQMDRAAAASRGAVRVVTGYSRP